MEKVLIVDTHLWRFLTNIWKLWAAAWWRVRLWIKGAHALTQAADKLWHTCASAPFLRQVHHLCPSLPTYAPVNVSAFAAGSTPPPWMAADEDDILFGMLAVPASHWCHISQTWKLQLFIFSNEGIFHWCDAHKEILRCLEVKTPHQKSSFFYLSQWGSRI